MKTIIATAAVALSLTAPAFADVSNAQAFFALGNDSAAERVVAETSTGNVSAVKAAIAAYNESAAEQIVIEGFNDVSRDSVLSAQSFFALGNDSAAERHVN